MNINRHNYEEFFILYLDNELGSDDRRMVEAFVLQHPDLKEELDLMLQYKFSPDPEIIFPGKEELIRVNGETPVTLTNYEEWLVLYVDDELSAGQRIEVEKFASAYPSVQQELALLQRSKLQPEKIIFKDKELLYRKEVIVRSLPFRRWRIAVAAVLLLGIGITTAVVINKRPAGKNEIVKGKSDQQKTNSPEPVVAPVKNENTVVSQQVVADNIQKVNTPVVKQENKKDIANNKMTIVKDKFPANIPSPVKKEEPIIAENNKPSNNLPQPLYNPNINKPHATNDAIANINPPAETNNTEGSLTTAPVTNIVPASYTNNDAGQLEEGGKNKKNRGFFRKLARTFEKRTNMTATDDDRLLVGGLAFKLK